jgi:RNA polymerase sigma-70 factor (ECF subfamily)
MRTDGGGVVNAARKPIEGATRVANVAIALSRAGGDTTAARLVDVNGLPGFALRDPKGQATVIAFTVDAERITAIDVVRNPAKLRGVG